MTRSSIQARTIAHYPQYAAAIPQAIGHDVLGDMVILPILVLTWLWVACGNGRGSQLARIAAIVLATLYVLVLGVELAEGLAQLAPASVIASGISCALGVTAVCFILAPQSWSYYERPSARRQDALV